MGRVASLGLVLLGLATAANVRADGEVDSRPSPSARLTLPVTLTADRARHWQEDGVRMILLEGHAASFLGDDGIRSDVAVVRITSTPDAKGKDVHKVEIYAQGGVRRSGEGGPAQAEHRETWTTSGSIDLSAATEKGLSALKSPPTGLAILARAFPRPKPAPVQPMPTKAASTPKDLPALPSPPGDPGLRPASGIEQPAQPKAKAKDKEKGKPDDRPIRFRDPDYKPVQFIDGPGFPQTPAGAQGRQAPAPPPAGAGGAAEVPGDFGPSIAPPTIQPPGGPQFPGARPPSELDPLPNVPPGRVTDRPGNAPTPDAPIVPGTGNQRVTSILGKAGPNYTQEEVTASDGTRIITIRGGVNLVTEDVKMGVIDIEADSAVIFIPPDPGGKLDRVGPHGELIQHSNKPMEVYLEGHVVLRRDARTLQGKDDQATFFANQAYYDYRADRFLGLDAKIELYSPGLMSPFRIKTPRVDQFHPIVTGPGGQQFPAEFEQIRAIKTDSTGSRFENPGYHFTSNSIDLTKVLSDNPLPYDGRQQTGPPPDRETWRLSARQNLFYMGPVPVFYHPKYETDLDDLDPVIRMFTFRTNNYFGNQVLLDINGFRLLNVRKPSWIDTWNIDVDYLSKRGPALGTELGWFGADPIRDLTDPYHRDRSYKHPGILTDYFGYIDLWGIHDTGVDDLGAGPAIITNNFVAGHHGFTRLDDPPFQEWRGRFNYRQMQSLNQPGDDILSDFHFNIEAGAFSDRNFLEQYYKRLFDTGLDHEILLYGIKQERNWAATILTEANPNAFNTETQWAPKLEYTRLGDSLLDNRLSYFGRTGIDYANTHTANDVNNKNTIAFLPFDPVSNTSRDLNTGRFYTAHELDMPINLEFLRVVPYVQGQVVGWNHQIDGEAVGRYMGAVGGRADLLIYKPFPDVDNELLNIHGLNHKIDFVADYRNAYSNVNLNHIGVQDDLDDNSYESVRRYFAMVNYAGGLLPMQYDPRFLLLRRATSPITGSTDIQASMQTLKLGIHQRLQTKRGPEGRRRIIDWMILDVDTTYFPNASRDNFNTPFGQTMYNYEWYIGDRTSITSFGWFEFFKISGDPLFKVVTKSKLNPIGLDIISTGININRPPRGNIFIGYSVIDTGLIQTSALISSYSYWMSPKWYLTFGSAYDFANQILLSANAAVTRVGKDYLISAGLTASPLQNSIQFGFEISPRISPSLQLGSSGLNRLNPAYAPKD
jgi:hypothetical protein